MPLSLVGRSLRVASFPPTQFCCSARAGVVLWLVRGRAAFLSVFRFVGLVCWRWAGSLLPRGACCSLLCCRRIVGRYPGGWSASCWTGLALLCFSFGPIRTGVARVGASGAVLVGFWSPSVRLHNAVCFGQASLWAAGEWLGSLCDAGGCSLDVLALARKNRHWIMSPGQKQKE